MNKYLYILALIVFVCLLDKYLADANYIEGFNSNYKCDAIQRVYLNGVGVNNMATGTLERTLYNDLLTIRLEANLPEPQLTFDYHVKSNKCNDLNNCHWDSKNCGNGDCLKYNLYVENKNTGNRVFVGSPRRFGDGIFRTYYETTDTSLKNYNKIILTVSSLDRNNNTIKVLEGCFVNNIC